MARIGWSMRNDTGRRLAWGDAWALFEHFCQDPASWLFAELAHMDYPADRLTLAVTGALGIPSPLHSDGDRPDRTDIDRARRNMSPRFQSLYKKTEE